MPIVYDNLGNPISYLGHNLTWEKGRQLKKFTKADGTVIQYTYNANGIRTSKTVGGVKHTYELDSTKILKETWGDCTLIPLYDNEDSVCGIMYDDAAYYFHKNLQGDVIEIKNAYGVCVARYTYDAWGKVVSITNEDGFDVSDNAAHVANANPFRYRGYYYDAEIEMYYLQSRYYAPVTGRFINGDETNFEGVFKLKIAHDNLYAYCDNNPVNLNDISGRWYLNYVAFGFQIEFGFGIGSVGLEFIITVDLKHIYAYFYGAASLNIIGSNTIDEIVKNILPNIFKKPQGILKLFKGFSFSICVFCVWRKWKNEFDPQAYTKGFKGAYITADTPVPLLSVKAYTAYSSSYLVIGAGASTGGTSFGVVPSYYWDVTPQFNFVMNNILSMSSRIKKVAQDVD